MEPVSSEYLLAALKENEHRLRQILSDSFIDDGNDDVHGEHNVADDASYEHIDDSAAFASDSFALRLLAVLRSRSSAPPGAVWDAYGEARARTLNTVLHDTSYQFTILVLDSHRLVDALVELSTAEFRIAWLLFENSVAATTVLKQLVLERLRTQVREEIRAVPHDQLVLCTVAFGLFSFTEQLKRSVAYAEALNLINEAAHQIRSLFDFEAMCRALEIKCGDAATALLTLTENERRKSILSTNNLLLDSDFSKEEECASIVHGYVVFCFVRDIVRRRKIAQAICRIVDTAEHKGKQLLAERPIHYAHIASILSVLANFRLRLSEAGACSALSADVLEIMTIEPKLTTTVKTLLDMVSGATISSIRLLNNDLLAIKQIVMSFDNFLANIAYLSFEEKLDTFVSVSQPLVELLQCFATENQHCFDQYRCAFAEIWEVIKFSRYYHPQMNASLQLCSKIMHHCEQSFHLLMKPHCINPSDKASNEQRCIVSIIAEAPLESRYLSQIVADHYPELYLTHLQSMLSSKTPNDQHLVQSVFACLLQSETNALYKTISLLNQRFRQLPQEDENDVSMPIPEAIIGAVDWREYCWYQAVQAACAETLAQVYDQWLIDSLNLEQISVLTALSSAIARLPLALFSVPSGAPIPPLALVVSIDAFVAWGRPIFDFASKDGKFGSDRRISAVVHCYNTALSLTPSRSVLPPLKEDIFSELVNRATHREIWAKSKLKRSSESYEAFTSQWLQSGVKNSGICSSSAQKDFISVILADELSEACS